MFLELLQLKFLQGHRTQLAAVAIAILTLLLHLNALTQEQYNTVIGFLTSVGLLTASVHKPK